MEEKEIKCPHCGKIFKIGASGYANIVKQVRDEEFKQELSERLHTFEKEKAEAIKLAEANTKNNLQKILFPVKFFHFITDIVHLLRQ